MFSHIVNSIVLALGIIYAVSIASLHGHISRKVDCFQFIFGICAYIWCVFVCIFVTITWLVVFRFFSHQRFTTMWDKHVSIIMELTAIRLTFCSSTLFSLASSSTIIFCRSGAFAPRRTATSSPPCTHKNKCSIYQYCLLKRIKYVMIFKLFNIILLLLAKGF